MSEMIRRVAVAICEARTWPGAWDRACEAEREAWYRDARAAIEAMRETVPVVRDQGGVVHQLVGAPEDIWHLLIDAALPSNEGSR